MLYAIATQFGKVGYSAVINARDKFQFVH